MTDEEMIIDLPHVAALSMAIWIYLINQDEKAGEQIASLADKLEASMTIVKDNNGQEGTNGSESDGAQGEG
jgi:hypothetical protein